MPLTSRLLFRRIMGSKKSLIEPRLLTDEENRKLQHQMMTLSELKTSLQQKEAAKNWDKFYKENTAKFFKDRHWLLREFQPLQILLASNEHTILFLRSWMWSWERVFFSYGSSREFSFWVSL